MWSVLSGDFDKDITPEKCATNVMLKAHSGDIVVFHDSEKARERMEYALPIVLAYFSNQGFVFKKITPELLKLNIIQYPFRGFNGIQSFERFNIQNCRLF
jgi:hypothetical protein